MICYCTNMSKSFLPYGIQLCSEARNYIQLLSFVSAIYSCVCSILRIGRCHTEMLPYTLWELELLEQILATLPSFHSYIIRVVNRLSRYLLSYLRTLTVSGLWKRLQFCSVFLPRT